MPRSRASGCAIWRVRAATAQPEGASRPQARRALRDGRTTSRRRLAIALRRAPERPAHAPELAISGINHLALGLSAGSTLPPREGAARDHVLPARRRRRRAAVAQARAVPARARRRDARARAGRSEVGAPRSRAAGPDAGVDPPRALRRAASDGSPRRSCAPPKGLERALVQAQVTARRLLLPGRERHLEPDGDPGCDPDRAPRGDRRGDHDLAAALGALRRRSGPEGDRRALDRRPARPARREPAPSRRHGGCARAAGRDRAGREARRAPGRRRHVRLRGDRGRDAWPRAPRARCA